MLYLIYLCSFKCHLSVYFLTCSVSCTTVDWTVSNSLDNLLESQCRVHISHHHKIWAQIRSWVNVKAELNLFKRNTAKYNYHWSSQPNPCGVGKCIEWPYNTTFLLETKICVYIYQAQACVLAKAVCHVLLCGAFAKQACSRPAPPQPHPTLFTLCCAETAVASR